MCSSKRNGIIYILSAWLKATKTKHTCMNVSYRLFYGSNWRLEKEVIATSLICAEYRAGVSLGNYSISFVLRAILCSDSCTSILNITILISYCQSQFKHILSLRLTHISKTLLLDEPSFIRCVRPKLFVKLFQGFSVYVL